MKWRAGLIAALLAVHFLTPIAAQEQDCPPLTSTQSTALRAQHLFGGQPSSGPTLVRRAYVTQYDATHRMPRWSAWRAAPDYLGTPDRDGPWASFRTDPDLPDAVEDDDYNGVGSVDMARGHIVPYFIGGGDRDHDGRRAEDDVDDACTVYEVNYMSNVTPQFQSSFNGSGGLWFEIETHIREDIVGGDAGAPIHIIAGPVFGDAPIETVGAGNMPIPHMFFQILITPSGVVPFLFIHTAQIGANGCALSAALADCIVTVSDIEDITGLDFFNALSDQVEATLETSDGAAVWKVLVRD